MVTPAAAVPNDLVLKLHGVIEKDKRDRRKECFRGRIRLGDREEDDDENLHM
mgnify:FL=1